MLYIELMQCSWGYSMKWRSEQIKKNDFSLEIKFYSIKSK